jgi:hypothetical protein
MFKDLCLIEIFCSVKVGGVLGSGYLYCGARRPHAARPQGSVRHSLRQMFR